MSREHRIQIEVACAIIFKNKKFFLAQRPNGKEHEGYWEFPGGKLQVGEYPKDCLVRELYEEFEIDVDVQECITTIYHSYEKFDISLHACICRLNSDRIQLKEHTNAGFFSVRESMNMKITAADFEVIEAIKKAGI